MIRKATQNDYEKVLALWNTAFGDEKNFTQWYFRNVYSYQHTVVFEKDNEIISMLQRLPFKTNKLEKITYIYGVCTHPNYRGNGLMKQLMNYSKSLDIQEGISASILIPQDESLFEYYSRFEYQLAFSIKKSNYNKVQIDDNNYQIRIAQIKDIEHLQNIYTKNLQDTEYILRDEKYWKLLLDLFKCLGGECFIISKSSQDYGYAFVWKEDNEIYIQELVANENKIGVILVNFILEKYNIENIEVLELGKYDTNQKLGSAVFYNEKLNREIKANLLFN